MRYKIMVMDRLGNWYDNAYIENSFDLIDIAKFYKNERGYEVRIYDMQENKDLTPLIDSAKTVYVKNEEI